MSSLLSPLSQEVESPAAGSTSAGTQLWERPLALRLTWPTTRLASWFFSLLLAGSVYLPTAGEATGWAWLALTVPVGVVVLSTKAAFEMLSLLTRAHRAAGRLMAAILAALLASALTAAASATVGGFSLLRGSIVFAASLVTLMMARARRSVEIRAQLGLRRVYFVGSSEHSHDLWRELARCHDREFVGATVLTVSGPLLDPPAVVGAALSAGATAAIFDDETMRLASVQQAADRLTDAGISVDSFTRFYEAEFKKVPLSELPSGRVLVDSGPGHRRLQDASLRGLELGLAAALLVATLPVFLLAAVAIRLTSSGPVLYRQRRVGRGGAVFTLLKLRTMTSVAGEEPGWAHSHAHRVTRIGAHLRRFRIDELPQLLNVLRGELALIGPRPEQVPIVERLRGALPHYDARHSVRPGITGWAQVNLGYAGSLEGTVAKLQRDLFYVKRRSVRLDALILWLTLKTVIAGRGS